jgi:hypothetical protein
MTRLPSTCSHCRRAFSAGAHGVRLAHLEFGRALCDRCLWLVDHPESPSRRRPAPDQSPP